MKLFIYISVFIGCLLSFQELAAQESIDSVTISNGLKTHFVKYRARHEPNKGLFFNSLKVENISNDTMTFYPKIQLPENWGVPKFVFIPKKVTLPPGKVKFIPFKASIPNTQKGGLDYLINFSLNDEKGESLVTTEGFVQIPVKRNWKMEALEKEVILLPQDSTKIRFGTRLRNLGNTNEIVTLQVKVNEKIEKQVIEIPPGLDTTFHFIVGYTDKVDIEGAEIEYVSLYAETNESYNTDEVRFVKFRNTYDGGNAKFRPNTLSLGIDNLTSFQFNRIALQTSGTAEFGKNAQLLYSIDNTDVLNFRQFLNVSNVNARYFSNKFEFGFGNLSTLGQNIHNINVASGRIPTQNGFNIVTGKYKHRFNPNHTTNVFVGMNVKNPITTVAANHSAIFNKTLLNAGGSYTLDFFGKKSTKIGFFETTMPVVPGHVLGVKLNYAQETHHVESFGPLDLSHLGTETLRESSYSFSSFYQGIIKNLNFFFSQSFSSPRYPSFQRGIFNASGEIAYTFPGHLHTLKTNFRHFKRTPEAYENGVEVPRFQMDINEVRVEYEMPINRYVSLEGGVVIRQYEAERPSITNELLPYASSYNGAFLSASIFSNGHYLSLFGYYGLSHVQDFISPTTGETYANIPGMSNVHLVLNYNTPGFTFGTRYTRGVNSTISDFEQSTDDILAENFNVFYNYRKYFFKRKLQARLNQAFRLDMFRNRVSTNISWEGNYLLKYGWGVYVRGSYNVLLQTKVGRTMNVLSRTEGGIVKNFDLAINLPHHNFEIIAFEDDNNNGQLDDGEKGIPDIQVTVTPVALGRNREAEFDKAKYKKVQLFTGKNGKMTFRKLPEGTHNVHIRQIMSSTTSYINLNGNQYNLELDHNKALYLPFTKSQKVYGKVLIDKDRFSKKSFSPSNIRISVKDEKGNKYDVLTRGDGSYEMPLPKSDQYTVTITHPFGRDVKLTKNNIKVTFDDGKDKEVNFEFKQIKKKINFN